MKDDGEQLEFDLGEPIVAVRGEAWTKKKGLVPYAFEVTGRGLDRTRPILPEKAVAGGTYGCPECDKEVRARAGGKPQSKSSHLPSGRKRPDRHFYHVAGESSCPFHGESWQHLVAKRLVHLAVLRWLQHGEARPTYRVKPECGHEAFVVPLPEETCKVECERRIELESSAVQPDVLLVDADNRPLLGIEVRFKGPVTEDKAERLVQGGLPTIEVLASAILEEEQPWPTKRSWALKNGCERCDSERGASGQEERANAEASSKNQLGGAEAIAVAAPSESSLESLNSRRRAGTVPEFNPELLPYVEHPLAYLVHAGGSQRVGSSRSVAQTGGPEVRALPITLERFRGVPGAAVWACPRRSGKGPPADANRTCPSCDGYRGEKKKVVLCQWTGD